MGGYELLSNALTNVNGKLIIQKLKAEVQSV